MVIQPFQQYDVVVDNHDQKDKVCHAGWCIIKEIDLVRPV